jgi:hypothetical protein
VRPWQTIPDDVTVYFVDLPAPLLGFCDHRLRSIWIATGLRQRQRRAVLQHELIHLERGPVYLHFRDREEAAVEEATARVLIPISDLCDALRWSRDVHDIADCLHVPAALVRVRADTMRHPAERAAIAAVIADLTELNAV